LGFGNCDFQYQKKTLTILIAPLIFNFFLLKFCTIIAELFGVIFYKFYLNRLRFGHFIMKRVVLQFFFSDTPYNDTKNRAASLRPLSLLWIIVTLVTGSSRLSSRPMETPATAYTSCLLSQAIRTDNVRRQPDVNVTST